MQYTLELTGKGDQILDIPNSLIENNLVKIRFEFPDAKSPKELGLSNDSRLLAVKFFSMTIIEK